MKRYLKYFEIKLSEKVQEFLSVSQKCISLALAFFHCVDPRV